MKKTFTFFFLLLVFSCNNFNEKNVLPAELTERISGRETLIGEKTAGLIFRVDTLLLLSLPKTEPFLYSVFSVNSNRYLGALIKRGSRMEAFSSILFCGQHQKDDDGIKIWVTDFITKEMDLINVTTSIQNKETVVEKRITIASKEIIQPLFSFYFHDKKIVGYHNVISTTTSLDERLFVLNPFNFKVKFKPIPSVRTPNETNSILRNMMYSGMSKLKPDASRIVEMRSYQPVVNIVDNFGNPITSLILEENYPTSFDQDMIAKRTYTHYNSWLEVSDNFIYVLKRDQVIKERILNKESTIIMLDWKGTMVKKLITSGHLLSFAVDEKNKIIYGFDFSRKKVFKYPF